jgi:hypothetical protein
VLRPRCGIRPGAIDGQFGPDNWAAWQRFLNDRGFNVGTVGGDIGPNAIREGVAAGSNGCDTPCCCFSASRHAWAGCSDARFAWGRWVS